MPVSVILGIAAILAFAAVVNGYLGGFLLLFVWMVLEGMIRQRVVLPTGVAQITQYTWAPALLWPVAIFLFIWQWRLRGHIGPQIGPRDLMRNLMRRRRSGFAESR